MNEETAQTVRADFLLAFEMLRNNLFLFGDLCSPNVIQMITTTTKANRVDITFKLFIRQIYKFQMKSDITMRWNQIFVRIIIMRMTRYFAESDNKRKA